jgi:3-hydroxyisobutyrate dehydrogenase-like beta-hydroxyacid dehydrogenase
VASHDLASIYDGSYDPSFSIRLCCKDLRLINELAAQLNVPIEMGSLAEQVFRRASNVYGEDAPELSVVRYLEDIPKTPLNTNRIQLLNLSQIVPRFT